MSDHSAVRGIKGCGNDDLILGPHHDALGCAGFGCPACLSLLVEGIVAMERDNMDDLRRELEGLRAFKRSVDEALNSGDGTYRP